MHEFLHAVKANPAFAQILAQLALKPGHWQWIALDHCGRVTLFHKKPWLDKTNWPRVWRLEGCKRRWELPRTMPLCFLQDAQRFYLEDTLHTLDDLLAVHRSLERICIGSRPSLPDLPAEISAPDLWL